MIIIINTKSKLAAELKDAKSIWIASAMISNNGWQFIQKSISTHTEQFYLIGIDLATYPSVFDSILSNPNINARVYKTSYTFHPKVYLIQKNDNTFTAIIGSSNTTTWGLEKNVEMNYQIHDQNDCRKLLDWFKSLYSTGYLITQEFVADYKTKFTRASIKSKEIDNEISNLKLSLTKNDGQFFSKNHHEIFDQKYHKINSTDLQELRKNVRSKFLELHGVIYPLFLKYGLTDLHCHHQRREIVSRHYFNPRSGNYINAMWLHYGKSLQQLKGYKTTDKSTFRPDSFVNNIRIQVIIHKESLGVWLVLGRNKGSKKDREHFREQMKSKIIQSDFLNALKKLGNDYWLNVPNAPAITDINTTSELIKQTQKETLENYFIIGCNIDWLDKRLSASTFSTTVLEEFRKLYPLYEIMRHK